MEGFQLKWLPTQFNEPPPPKWAAQQIKADYIGNLHRDFLGGLEFNLIRRGGEALANKYFWAFFWELQYNHPHYDVGWKAAGFYSIKNTNKKNWPQQEAHQASMGAAQAFL